MAIQEGLGGLGPGCFNCWAVGRLGPGSPRVSRRSGAGPPLCSLLRSVETCLAPGSAVPPAVAAPTPFAPGSGPRRTPRPAPNAAGQPVFNPPVPTPDLQQPGSIRPLRRQAGAGIGPFYRLFALVPPGPFHATDLCQAGPVQVVVQGRRGPQTPPLPPVSVPALLARRPSWLAWVKLSPQGGCSKSKLTASFTEGWLSFSAQK